MEKENGFSHFLKYNNAVPIILGILFLGTTTTLAATPAVRDAVYRAEEAVRSVDNSYLLSADLEDYAFSMRITAVSEDDAYYYLDYEFSTLAVAEYVWQDVLRKDTLRISKGLLRGGDLEAYAESELAQVRDFERSRLLETQAYERTIGQRPKTVATVYSGIVGKFFEPTTETYPLYKPPPQIASEDDPLASPEAKPLLTWDANAKPKEPAESSVPVSPREPEEHEEGEEVPAPPPTDVCPYMEGIQINPTDCSTEETTTPDEPTATTTPEEPVPEPEEPASEPEPAPEESSGENAGI